MLYRFLIGSNSYYAFRDLQLDSHKGKNSDRNSECQNCSLSNKTVVSRQDYSYEAVITKKRKEKSNIRIRLKAPNYEYNESSKCYSADKAGRKVNITHHSSAMRSAAKRERERDSYLFHFNRALMD